MLRDATGFALGHTRVADVVKQRRFAVVDVAHDGHDRSTGAQVLCAVARIHINLLLFSRQEFHVETEFVGNYGDGFGIKALVDGHEHAHAQTHFDYLVHVHIHQRSQIVGRDEFGEFEDFGVELVLRAQSLTVLRQHAALVAAVLGAVLIVAALIAAELGQCGLNLLLNLLFSLLGRERRGIWLGSRLAGALTRTAGAVALAGTTRAVALVAATRATTRRAVALVAGARGRSSAAGRAGQAGTLLLARASGQAALAHIRRSNGTGATATRTTAVVVNGRQIDFTENGQALQRVRLGDDGAGVFNRSSRLSRSSGDGRSSRQRHYRGSGRGRSNCHGDRSRRFSFRHGLSHGSFHFRSGGRRGFHSRREDSGGFHFGRGWSRNGRGGRSYCYRSGGRGGRTRRNYTTSAVQLNFTQHFQAGHAGCFEYRRGSRSSGNWCRRHCGSNRSRGNRHGGNSDGRGSRHCHWRVARG